MSTGRHFPGKVDGAWRWPSISIYCRGWKGKVRPRTCHKTQRESRGIALLYLSPRPNEGGWLSSSPGRFTPGKEIRYPFYSCLGGTQGRYGQVQKISPPPGFDPRTVQPVASRPTVLRLGMSRVIPPFPHAVFMACTRTTLPVTIPSRTDTASNDRMVNKYESTWNEIVLA